jgi:hypothetical protein
MTYGLIVDNDLSICIMTNEKIVHFLTINCFFLCFVFTNARITDADKSHSIG